MWEEENILHIIVQLIAGAFECTVIQSVDLETLLTGPALHTRLLVS